MAGSVSRREALAQTLAGAAVSAAMPAWANPGGAGEAGAASSVLTRLFGPAAARIGLTLEPDGAGTRPWYAAKAAGVSLTTVTHALNPPPGARVRPATRQRIQQIALFFDRAAVVSQTCTIGAFDEFRDLFAGIALSVLPVCNLRIKIKALREERLFARLKELLLDQPVNEGISETTDPVINL